MSVSPPMFRTGVRAPRDAGLSLTTTVAQSFRVDVVPQLFKPGNAALPTAWDRARRLVVISDRDTGDRGRSLASYLHFARHAGLLDDFVIIEPGSETADPLGFCAMMAESAAEAQLGRHDAFVAFGGHRIGQLAAIAAASFRRHTLTVRVHHDLAALVAVMRNGYEAVLDDEPIGASQRITRIVVDEDGLLAPGPAEPSEEAALLLLALLDREVQDQMQRADSARSRAEGLSALIRLSHRAGPGHPAWRIGTELRPLAPDTLDPPGRWAWSLQLAADVSYRLGFLDGDTRSDLGKLAAGRLPGVPRPADSGVQADALRRWLAAGQPDHRDLADPEAVTLCLPTGSGAELVRVDRSLLADMLTSGSVLLAPPGTGSGLRRLPVPGHQLVIGIQDDRTVPVSFPVLFTGNVLVPGDDLSGLLPAGCRVLAVVDPYRPGHVREVTQLLDGYLARGDIRDYAVLPVAANSRAKTLTETRLVIAEADRLKLTEQDRVLAIGGGTVMDIAGYASYLYQGRTPYIRVPTTLVGMIDAGVGLKVGVNVSSHKSLLGAYHPPLACVCDTEFLRTLPEPERRCGLAEAIKISVVCDAALFDLIEQHHADVLAGQDTPGVRAILNGSISCMLRQLEANPVEDNLRRLPDFGHEFGHAVESLSQYRLRHGEAVAIGMALSSWLAASVGYLSRGDLRRILDLLLSAGLGIYDEVCDPGVLWRKLQNDVLPHKAGHLHLVVPRAIGTGGFIDSIEEISPELLAEACQGLRDWNAGIRP